MKKALSLFLVFIMTFGIVAVGIAEMPHFHAEEVETQSFTENNFVYKIVNDKSIIIDYADKQSTDEIIIPETLGGYPVTELAAESFKGCQCIAVTIPASVTDIDIEAFAYDMPNIERYTVDENNTKYSSPNGILFCDVPHIKSTGDKLFAYPKNAPAESLDLTGVDIGSLAFTEVRNLKSISLARSESPFIYYIDKYAFYNATSLESVVLEDYIESIGDYAFASCPSLVSVTISHVVEKLGWEIFADTPFINDIKNYDGSGVLYLDKNLIATHPSGDTEYYQTRSGTKSIAGGAFQWNSLKEISIGSSVEYIDSNPFAKCPNLESFTVHETSNLKVDDYGVLYSRKNGVLNSENKIIAYPNGIHGSCYRADRSIVSYAFYLSPIKNIHISSNVGKMGCCALGGEGVTDIYYEGDESSWKNVCYNKEPFEKTITAEDVAEIHFEKYSTHKHSLVTDNAICSVCSCGYTVEHTYAEGNCTEDGFIYDIINKTAIITGYKFRESTSKIVIPETIDGYPVTKLERGAFRDCMFAAVHIPANVNEIDPEAFAYALNNQSFTVASENKNFKAIDGVLFKNGSVASLVSYPQNAPASEYEKPHGTVEILPYAFYGSKNLKTINSWYSVIVRDYAFLNSGIETISDSYLQRIGNFAFKNSGLKEFSITSTPEYFGYNAFEGTPFLENAVYDNDGVFYHENILMSVDKKLDKNYYAVKDGTTVIAGGAIKWKSLEEIYLPNSVVTVNGSSFSEATSLKTFTLDSDNPNFKVLYHSVLFNSAATKLIAYPPAAENICFWIPETVTEIGAFAFNNVKQLCCVNVPKCVSTIGEYAFGMPGFRHILRIEAERKEANWKLINFEKSGSDLTDCETIITKVYEEYHFGYHSNVKTETDIIGTGCDERTCVTYHCTCGCAFSFTYAPKGVHVPEEEYTVVKEPTCTATGSKNLKCTVCSNVLKTKTIPALGHDNELIEHIKATCLDNGEKTYKCKRCNKVSTQEAESALGHISSGETVKIDPTCTENGGLYYLCDRCNVPILDECLEVYPATGHTPGEWKCTQEPTCTYQRVDTLYCSVCTQAIETKTGDYGTHIYRDELAYEDCTYRCYIVYCIGGCGDEYDEVISAPDDAIFGEDESGLGHIVEEVTKEPTCTQPGKKYKRCTVCGETVGEVTELSEALGHKWEEEIYYEPTCYEEGTLRRRCTVCRRLVYEDIPMVPHTFEKWEYVNGNTFSGICDVCGEEFELIDVEITLDTNKTTIYNQSTKTLAVTVTENITDDIVFTSSDSSVASVDENGTITANAPGNAVITARINGTEITAQCEVTVNARRFGIEWIVDGKLYYYSHVREGSEIETLDTPEIAGYTFIGWTPEVPEIMPSDNLSFTAVYATVSQSADYDVSATYYPGCFDEEVTLEVDLIQGEREPGGVYMVDGEYYKQVGLYNIKTVNENSEVIQPNDGYKVTIRLAIPEAYKNQTSFMIYHRFVDGGREQLSTENGTLKVENGYLVFDVTKFSEFEIFIPAVSPSMRISRLPDKTIYVYKTDDIDLTGIKLTITRSDGTTKSVTDTKHIYVTDFDNTVVGTQTVTVKYGQYTDTMEVEVVYTWWQQLIRILFFGFLWY